MVVPLRASLKRHAVLRRGLRLAASAALAVITIAVCRRLPHIDVTAVALLLVLVVLGIAMRWGRADAVLAAAIAALGLDHYFLPAAGLGIEAPEHWVVLAVFAVTAVSVGQLSVRVKKQAAAAVERQRELEKLYAYGEAVLQGVDVESTIGRSVEHIVRIFRVDTAAFYYLATGRTCLAGDGAPIPEAILRETAAREEPIFESGIAASSVRWEGRPIGALALRGSRMSRSSLLAIANRLAVGIARARAIDKAAEVEALRKAEELKSAVLDALAHEIKGPLASIKVAAASLDFARPKADVHQREMLDIIAAEADRLAGWADEAVEVARLEANDLAVEKQLQDVRHVVFTVLEEIGPALYGRQVQVRFSEDLPATEFDSRLIAKALRQLLDNALKYSPSSSALTLSSEVADDSVVISVADRGIGIPDDEREHIFEKHFRGRGSRPDALGHGLGLSAVRQIVHAHGGRIWVNSDPAGETVFHFSLPLVREVAR